MPFFNLKAVEATTRLTTNIAALAGTLIASLVTWSTLNQGLPALRHDWHIPYASDLLGPNLATYFQPWLEQGIGSPQPYPTFYMLGFILWPMHYVLGAVVIAAFILIVIVAICFASAFSIASLRGATLVGSLAVAAFAAINPWVYSELVAGHIFMVLAYGLLLALFAETSRRVPRQWMLVILGALLITQIQFFLLAIIPFLIWCIRRRFVGPLIMTSAAAVPIMVGIVANFGHLLTTPYNLAWETSQSVPLRQGLVLLGYQFNYAAEFGRIHFALVGIGIVAAIGVYLSLKLRRDLLVLSMCFFCLVFSTGTTWLIAPLYRSLVLNFAESGIFRELYDLLAIVAVGYVIALGTACRNGVTAGVLAILALTLTAPWMSRPAASYFVNAASIPPLTPRKYSSFRVALLPAFQPLEFQHRGSGYDPDAYEGSSVPINEPFPSFPVENALAAYDITGDTKSLSALSVSEIIMRPYLHTDRRQLKHQIIFSTGMRTLRAGSNTIRNPFPLVAAYARPPKLVSIGNLPTEYAIFLGDLPDRRSGFFALPPSRETTDPSLGWVDARLAYMRHPEWGSAFGGVATTSRTQLDLPAGTKAVLAESSGHIFDDRHRRLQDSRGMLHWVPTKTTRYVICEGLCVVALATTVGVKTLPEHAWSARFTALRFKQFAPWFATVTLPVSAGGLRYNVAYSPFWTAFDGLRVLKHTRLDESVNVWIPNRSETGKVYLVNVLAAAQFMLEVLSFIAVVSVAARSYFRQRGSRRRAT